MRERRETGPAATVRLAVPRNESRFVRLGFFPPLVSPLTSTTAHVLLVGNTAAMPMTLVPDRDRTVPAGIAPIASRCGPPVSSIATAVGFGYVPPRSPPAAPDGGNVAATPTIDVPDRVSTVPAGIAPIVSRCGPLVSSIATTVGLGYVPPRSPLAAPAGGNVGATPTTVVPTLANTVLTGITPIASLCGSPVSSIATTVGFGYDPPRSPPAGPGLICFGWMRAMGLRHVGHVHVVSYGHGEIGVEPGDDVREHREILGELVLHAVHVETHRRRDQRRSGERDDSLAIGRAALLVVRGRANPEIDDLDLLVATRVQDDEADPGTRNALCCKKIRRRVGAVD